MTTVENIEMITEAFACGISIKDAIEAYGIDINSKDYMKNDGVPTTILIKYCSYRDVNLMNDAIECGADFNIRDVFGGVYDAVINGSSGYDNFNEPRNLERMNKALTFLKEKNIPFVISEKTYEKIRKDWEGLYEKSTILQELIIDN